MKIILMRHGKPILQQPEIISPAEMEQWIERYNVSEVEHEEIPSISLQLANSAACIVASTAPRSLSSVQALGHAASIVDAIFCEAQLPFALWRFPRIPPFAWATFFRILWFFGYSRGAESFQATKDRATTATYKLISFAERGSVLLVGHGIMNRLIAKELVALGWVSSTKHKSKYWRANIYELKT